MNPNYAFVARRAGRICEYCRAPEAVFNLPFEVEHIKPLSRGGNDSENNPALSCRSCNLYKSDAISGIDEESQNETRLFNPRIDVWSEHFAINDKTSEIKGLTAIGRVTVSRLRMNGKAQVSARIQWLKLNLFD
ncbi:MAG: HNH endonuclease [Acidobacteriota bacterium]|nr:HNH endonuclease [Acidobacteriota bacterium]